MAQIRLEQILSNLSYNTGSNVLHVSGALDITQTDPLYPALTNSGSFYVVDSPGVESGSYNGNAIDGGTY
jgi:hypothetical protein